MKNKINILILSAAKPHLGKLPAPLWKTPWGIESISLTMKVFKSNYKNTELVGGYDINKIKKKYPKLKIINNPKWKNNGSLQSFLKLV